MGRNHYPLNDRINACDRELAQLYNDHVYLKKASSAIRPEANFGTIGQLIAINVSHGDQRRALAKARDMTVHFGAHQRRMASFRRVLETLQKDCPSGSEWAAKTSEMLFDADRLAHATASCIKRLEQFHIEHHGSSQFLASGYD